MCISSLFFFCIFSLPFYELKQSIEAIHWIWKYVYLHEQNVVMCTHFEHSTIPWCLQWLGLLKTPVLEASSKKLEVWDNQKLYMKYFPWQSNYSPDVFSKSSAQLWRWSAVKNTRGSSRGSVQFPAPTRWLTTGYSSCFRGSYVLSWPPDVYAHKYYWVKDAGQTLFI